MNSLCCESRTVVEIQVWLLWCVQVAVRAMARGQQKIQSQQKNAKKAAEKKKSQGADQKMAAKAALVHTCPVCRVSTPPQQDAAHAGFQTAWC